NNRYLANYDLVIYVDGNIIINKPNFISQYFVSVLQKDPEIDIIISKHPYWNSIYYEMIFASYIGKYANTDFDRMKEFYQNEGIQPESGLYWNGLIGYNQRNNLDAFHDLYIHEMFEYIKDPQYSF